VRKLAVSAAIAALASLLAWVGGCVSAPLPAAVDEDGASSRLDLELGVEADRVAPFSDELVRALAASGIFARLDRLDHFASPPDLVATVEHGWRGNAAIPIFTALSLGLIPTVVERPTDWPSRCMPRTRPRRRSRSTRAGAAASGSAWPRPS
jgi:hypothetical protein